MKRYPSKLALTTNQQAAIAKYLGKLKSKEYEYEEACCPLCSESRTAILFVSDYFGLPVHTSVCNKCGLVYENPRLTKKNLDEFYSTNLYRDIYGHDETNESNWIKNDDVVPFNKNKYDRTSLLSFISSSKVRYHTVLEIGCGAGWYLEYFIKKGFIVKGLEPSVKLREIAKSRNIDVTDDDIKSLNSEFDLIIMRHVLEHIPDLIEFLKAVVAKSNKYVLIEIPGFNSKIPKIQNAHLFYFTKNTLKVLCSIVGLKTISLHQFKENGFIIGLFSKANSLQKHSYNKLLERTKIFMYYFYFQFRYIIKNYLFRVNEFNKNYENRVPKNINTLYEN